MEENAWNVATLKAHFEAMLAESDKRQQQRYDAQNKAVDAALAAQEKAVNSAMASSEKAIVKAETAAEKRFEGVNEFRQTVTDITAGNVTKAELRAIVDRLAMADERNATDVQELKRWQNTMQGRGSGLEAGWGKIVGAAGLMSTLMGMALILTR